MKFASFFSKLGATAALLLSPGFSVPVLTGSGAEPDAATGSFGTTGHIFEYRVQTSPGIAFTSSMTALADQLHITYEFTALSALADVFSVIYMDADINQDANTWFNERGEALVTAGGANTWEIDEPGFGSTYIGDIYDHYVLNTLDNSVFNGQPDLIEDVAMGMGLNIGSLGAGDKLSMEVLISETSIGAGWGTVLHQWDADDGLAGENLYLANRYSITRFIPPPPDTLPDPDPNPDPGPIGAVPEPGTIAMFALGLAALGFVRRRS